MVGRSWKAEIRARLGVRAQEGGKEKLLERRPRRQRVSLHAVSDGSGQTICTLAEFSWGKQARTAYVR